MYILIWILKHNKTKISQENHVEVGTIPERDSQQTFGVLGFKIQTKKILRCFAILQHVTCSKNLVVLLSIYKKCKNSEISENAKIRHTKISGFFRVIF